MEGRNNVCTKKVRDIPAILTYLTLSSPALTYPFIFTSDDSSKPSSEPKRGKESNKDFNPRQENKGFLCKQPAGLCAPRFPYFGLYIFFLNLYSIETTRKVKKIQKFFWDVIAQ